VLKLNMTSLDPIADVLTRYGALIDVAAWQRGHWSSVGATLKGESQKHIEIPGPLLQPRSGRERADGDESLFFLDHECDDFSTTVNRWLELDIEVMIALDGAVRSAEEPFLQERVRRLCISLEGLSDLAVEYLPLPIDDSQLASIVDAVNTAVNDDIRDSVVAQVRGVLSRPSFRRRLKSIVALLEGGSEWAASAEQEALLSTIISVRDSASHAATEAEQPTFKSYDDSASYAEMLAKGVAATALGIQRIDHDVLLNVMNPD